MRGSEPKRALKWAHGNGKLDIYQLHFSLFIPWRRVDEMAYESCELCGAGFRYGSGAYHGHYISRYQMIVCRGCSNAIWGEWSFEHEPRLMEHLKNRGLPIPARNRSGRIPQD